MAEKLHDYYRIYFHSSELYSPLLNKKGMIREIELSLLHVPSEADLNISIEPYQMTKKQYKNREHNLRNYTSNGIEH